MSNAKKGQDNEEQGADDRVRRLAWIHDPQFRSEIERSVNKPGDKGDQNLGVTAEHTEAVELGAPVEGDENSCGIAEKAPQQRLVFQADQRADTGNAMEEGSLFLFSAGLP